MKERVKELGRVYSMFEFRIYVFRDLKVVIFSNSVDIIDYFKIVFMVVFVI